MTSIDFHGLSLTVIAPDCVLDALPDRFGHFPANARLTSDLLFEYKVVPELHMAKPLLNGFRPFYEAEMGHALYAPATDEIYLESDEGIVAVCSPRNGTCTISVIEPLHTKLWLLTHPFITLPLMEMLKRRNLFAIHSAGVGLNGRSILISGTSGSGKTTLTVALLRAGFDFLGDDLTVLNTSSTLKALAFPEVIDITEKSASFFPELLSLTSTPRPHGWLKQRLHIGEFYKSPIAWNTAPVAILFPKVANAAESSLVPMRPTEALMQLSSSVLLTDKGSTGAHLGTLGELTRTLPSYRLLTGRDFDRMPHLLGPLLDGD